MTTYSSSDAKPLVIDCQVFQTAAWHRGMGKYSLALLRYCLELPEIRDRPVYLLFNKNAENNEGVKNLLKEVIPEAHLLEVSLLNPREPRDRHSVEPIRQKNKLILNKTLLKYFTSPVDFIILALYLDDVCPAFPNEMISEKALLYYDAIPYLYHYRYGQFKGFFENFYLPHTATVFEATKIFTISKTVANDLHIFFGIPEHRIFNIDGASIPRSSEKAIKPHNLSLVPGTFVLMPSGQELRKNNERATQAFQNFLVRSNKDLKLVMTSYFTKEARHSLRKLSESVIFTGNVSEPELTWLYQNCKFVLFASEYEGLGLPVLEAVDHDKLVACSDISVFREMSKKAFYYFDPLDEESITHALLRVDAKAAKEPDSIKKEYINLREKYSWHITAHKLSRALSSSEHTEIHKKRIAILCPDPSGFSAIGKVIAESHAWYSEYFDIDYYYDKGRGHRVVRPNPIEYAAPHYDAADFNENRYKKYDAVIYHVGNSEYHLNTIRAALSLPGYVILHDTNLEGAYKNLVEASYISEKRFVGEKRLDDLLNNDKLHLSAFLTSIVNNQIGVVVHSEYAKDAVKAKLLNSKIKVSQINLPVDTPIFSSIEKNYENRHIVISFGGIIAKIKGTDFIEKVALSPIFSECHINVFGFSAVAPQQLLKLSYLPNVSLKTNPTDFEFQQLMRDTDILLNVRLAYQGETSLTTLEEMRYGGLVMVRDFGWYSELPDNVVIKVSNTNSVLKKLENIINRPSKIRSMGSKAIRYINANHSHHSYAEEMYKLINE